MNSIPLFEKFTEQAKKVVRLAQEEAQRFQHNAVGTEHILLGLVREGTSIAAHVLESQEITPDKMRKAVEELKGYGDVQIEGEPGLTLHATMAIEIAMKEAERQFLPPGSTGQLIGSIYMQESEAAKILQEEKLPPHLELRGIALEDVRKALAEAKGRGVRLLFDQGSPENTPTGEAERRRHPLFRVNTENILIGVLRVPESTGAKLLQALGVPPLKDVKTLMFLDHGTLPLAYREYAQRFTKSARKAWKLAHAEARRLQDGYVGTHHLLSGLVAEDRGIAATVLSQMGIELEKLREQVKPSYEAADWNMPDDIKLQPRLKHVIELASNEARRLFHPSIGTGHLLLALVYRQGEGIAASMLEALGVDIDKLRTVVGHALRDTPEQEGEVGTTEDEDGIYASHASIASIEKGLQSRELDKTILAVYPFTLEARDVLENARIQAQHLAQVEPEHLLAGLAFLTFRNEGPVSKVFKDLGIDDAQVQAAVENRLGQRVRPEPVVLTYGSSCKACLLLAANEAERRSGSGTQIKSEHLLLGLLREERGGVANLLSDLGVSVETIRTKLEEVLRDSK